MIYDHTDALRSPMLEAARADHIVRMKQSFRQAEVDNRRLLRPAEMIPMPYSDNPHTRIGY